MSDEQKELKKCSGCSSLMLLNYFKMNRKGEYNTTCISCAETRKQRYEKNKCEHNRKKSNCKECGGGSICKHNRIKSRCKECGGGSICEHNRRKSECKECGGSQICEHNRIKSACKECGGSQICEHNRQKSKCKECGGSQICEHNRIKSTCKECGGGSICEHNRRRSECKECDPVGHLSHLVNVSVNKALKANKSKHSIEYLGCNIEEFKEHIENQFVEGMTWENHGEWHIDHIIPIKYEKPSLEEVIERLHWKNTQPLWATDNIAKGNRFIG
jgi:hypothetical protein